jgi:hypothetical protein
MYATQSTRPALSATPPVLEMAVHRAVRLGIARMGITPTWTLSVHLQICAITIIIPIVITSMACLSAVHQSWRVPSHPIWNVIRMIMNLNLPLRLLRQQPLLSQLHLTLLRLLRVATVGFTVMEGSARIRICHHWVDHHTPAPHSAVH